MNQSGSEKPISFQEEFWIGSWGVNPALDELHQGETTIKLEPRTMRLLVFLAQNAGQVLNIEQLLGEVWKDVVVTSDSVYQAIGQLRRALGDDSRKPAYTANVPRRGYRLIAPVTQAVAEPSRTMRAEGPFEPVSPQSSLEAIAPSDTGSHRRRWQVMWASVLTLIAVAA